MGIKYEELCDRSWWGHWIGESMPPTRKGSSGAERRICRPRIAVGQECMSWEWPPPPGSPPLLQEYKAELPLLLLIQLLMLVHQLCAGEMSWWCMWAKPTTFVNGCRSLGSPEHTSNAHGTLLTTYISNSSQTHSSFHFRHITQPMSFIHGPSSRFKNKNSRCCSMAAEHNSSVEQCYVMFYHAVYICIYHIYVYIYIMQLHVWVYNCNYVGLESENKIL